MRSSTTKTPAKPSREFLTVTQILKKLFKEDNLQKDVDRYGFVLKWEEIVGKEVAEHTRVDFFKKGVLGVRVGDSVWAQELSFRKPQLLRAFRRHVKESPVSNIIFYVGELA